MYVFRLIRYYLDIYVFRLIRYYLDRFSNYIDHTIHNLFVKIIFTPRVHMYTHVYTIDIFSILFFRLNRINLFYLDTMIY